MSFLFFVRFIIDPNLQQNIFANFKEVKKTLRARLAQQVFEQFEYFVLMALFYLASD
jgi:hypothetical protein